MLGAWSERERRTHPRQRKWPFKAHKRRRTSQKKRQRERRKDEVSPFSKIGDFILFQSTRRLYIYIIFISLFSVRKGRTSSSKFRIADHACGTVTSFCYFLLLQLLLTTYFFCLLLSVSLIPLLLQALRVVSHLPIQSLRSQYDGVRFLTTSFIRVPFFFLFLSLQLTIPLYRCGIHGQGCPQLHFHPGRLWRASVATGTRAQQSGERERVIDA